MANIQLKRFTLGSKGPVIKAAKAHAKRAAICLTSGSRPKDDEYDYDDDEEEEQDFLEDGDEEEDDDEDYYHDEEEEDGNSEGNANAGGNDAAPFAGAGRALQSWLDRFQQALHPTMAYLNNNNSSTSSSSCTSSSSSSNASSNTSNSTAPHPISTNASKRRRRSRRSRKGSRGSGYGGGDITDGMQEWLQWQREWDQRHPSASTNKTINATEVDLDPSIQNASGGDAALPPSSSYGSSSSVQAAREATSAGGPPGSPPRNTGTGSHISYSPKKSTPKRRRTKKKKKSRLQGPTVAARPGGGSGCERLVLDVDLVYVSQDMDIVLTLRSSDVKSVLPEATVTLSGITLSGVVRLDGELTPQYPFIGNTTVGFLCFCCTSQCDDCVFCVVCSHHLDC